MGAQEPQARSASRWAARLAGSRGVLMPKIVLHGDSQRRYAHESIDAAPQGAVVSILAPTRTNEQNAKMWAMLEDLRRAEPEGRKWTKDTWKAALMHSLGHQVQFAEGLDNSGPFPVGF